MKILLILITALLCCWITSASAEEGMIIRMSTVYNEASSTSARVALIEAGSKVSVFERQGGWKLIFSDQKSLTGWVRSYQVRSGYYAEAPTVQTEADSRGFLSGLASFSRKASSFFGGGSSTTNNSSTATIGVRGLSEEEIRIAVPDFKELEKMYRYASNSQRMPSFSGNGQLVARPITHLVEIKPDKEKGKQ